MGTTGGRRRSERALVGVSLAQLACGLTGAAVAVRRGHAYDVGFSRGASERVARDAILTGTALSAPGPMLVTQAVLTAVVARRGSARAATGLRVLGALMTSGYLAERLVRHRLRRRGWDPVESPLVTAGIGLSLGMVLVGRRAGPASSSPSITATPRGHTTFRNTDVLPTPRYLRGATTDRCPR